MLCSRTAKVDLTLTAQPTADGSVHCTLEFNTALFDRSTAERILGRLVALAEAVVAQPGVDVWVLPIATPADDAMLVRFNSTKSTKDPRCLHDMVLAQAKCTP